MVKRQRRMTKKKFNGGKKPKVTKKPTKTKKILSARSKTRRAKSSKVDRANQATKVLMKALKKQTEDSE